MFFWIQVTIILLATIKFTSTDSMNLYLTSGEETIDSTKPNGINSYLAGFVLGLYHCGLMTTLLNLNSITKSTLIQLFGMEYITRHHLDYCINKTLRPSKKIIQIIGYINGCMLLLFQFTNVN